MEQRMSNPSENTSQPAAAERCNSEETALELLIADVQVLNRTYQAMLEDERTPFIADEVEAIHTRWHHALEGGNLSVATTAYLIRLLRKHCQHFKGMVSSIRSPEQTRQRP